MITIETDLFDEVFDILVALKVAADEMEADQRLTLFARMATHGPKPISAWSLRRLIDRLEEAIS